MLSLKCQRFLSVSLSKTMKAKVVLLNKKFDGLPTPENFKVIEENLRPINNGEFLVEAEYISVDPYQRIYPPKIGETMTADQVAKIIESQNPKYPVGEYVVGEWGWRSHTIANEQSDKYLLQPPRILTGYENLPRSLALGVLGTPGIAAYFGFLNVCKPTKGNTVVVSGAAGAVGTIVGQIAKIEGCRAVGITSSDEKGQRLMRDVGYDAYVNYKSKTFEKDLLNVTQEGIDCYFDNVGGEISSFVLASEVQTPLRVHHLVMEGFSVLRWKGHWEEAIHNNMKWIKEGRLKPFEYIVQGMDKTPEAFRAMFAGDNFGKTVVKVQS